VVKDRLTEAEGDSRLWTRLGFKSESETERNNMHKLTALLILILALPVMAKDVMLMNRIGPSKSELYVAYPDGSGEHKLLPTTGFDYHASYSYDGKWIVFTSERSG
jgi:hypothetical protein